MALGSVSSGNMQRAKHDTSCVSKTYGKNETKISSTSAPALEGDYILMRFSSLLPQISCNNSNDTARFKDSSVKENRPLFGLIPGDSAVILPVIIPSFNRGWISPTQPLLDMIGLEEVECLNPSTGGPAAGQCQFACVSSALSDSFISLGNDSRLDLELRRLALRVIETNPTMYQDFLTTAGCRTRSKSLHGGSSVDIKAYIATMSNPACDGDAVTLQALCDALKITVRVTKLIEADLYDPAGQTVRLLASSRSTSDHCQGFTESRESSSLVLDEDSCSSGSSDTSSSYASAISHASMETLETSKRIQSYRSEYGSFSVQDKCAGKRLHISHDIQPRCLSNVDAEIKRFTPYSQGRLIWLSHVGDEAHYRLLRLKHASDASDYCVINRDEEITASESRIKRLLKLQASNQLLDFNCDEKVPTERFPLTCMKIGVNPTQIVSGRCTLCLKTLYDDAVETRGSSSFCNTQCLSMWPTFHLWKSPSTQKRMINLVDDTQAPIMNYTASLSHTDVAKPTNTTNMSGANNKSHTNRYPNRSETVMRLRPRPSHSCSMVKARPMRTRTLRKRLIRPVDRYVAKM